MRFDINKIEQILKNENLYSDTLGTKKAEIMKENLDSKVAAQKNALGLIPDFSSSLRYSGATGDAQPTTGVATPTGAMVSVAGIGANIIVNEQKLNTDPRFTPGFVRKVKEVAAALNVRYEYLLIIMAFESDSTFNPKRKNKASGALGLIGFMNDSAKQVNSSMAKLESMSQVEQMEYVKRWFKVWGVEGKDFIYMYTCILFPYAKDKPNDFVLFGKGAINELFTAKGYTQNKGLDLNKDGSVTKLEACTHAWRIGIENLNGIITTASR
jgi:hypothetical protein